MTLRGQQLMSFGGVRRVIAGLSVGLASTFALATSAFAQEAGGALDDAADSGVGGGVTTFGIGEWFGLGIRLALVVAVIWAAVAAMRWYVRRMNGSSRRGAFGALEVLETHALGPNRSLHLVRLGDRAVLIGATQERITQLLTVDDPDDLKRLLDEPEETISARTSGRGRASLVSSLGAGLSVVKAMNARRREVNARIKEQRDEQREMQRRMSAAKSGARGRMDDDLLDEDAPASSRLGTLKNALARTTAQRQTLQQRAPRDVEPRETRQSLFDRTLASIDAVEIAPEGPRASMGLRARSGYGQTSAIPDGAPTAGRGRPRDAQIAELQRAIAAARRNVG